MKRVISMAAALSLMTAGAFAQSQMLDDFEGGVSDWTVQGFQGESAAAYNTEGANGTSASMLLTDDGFSFFVNKEFLDVVAAGEDGIYRLSFYIKANPDNTGNVLRGFSATANGDSVVLNATATSDSVQPDQWELVVSDTFNLVAGDNLTVEFTAGNGPVADGPWHLLVDEIFLEKLEAEPITIDVRPITGNWLGGDTTLTAVPAGGSETFTSVGYDIDNDGIIDETVTDSASDFAYQYVLPSGASDEDVVTIRVVATDDQGETGERLVTYTLAPTQGREILFTSDFENWTGLVPQGWNRVDIDGDGNADSAPGSVVEIETDNPFGGASALKITYDDQPDPFRYAFLSNSFVGDRLNYTVQGAIRATSSFGRLYLFASDDEVTWVNGFVGVVGASTSSWQETVGDAGSLDSEFGALATHFFGAGTVWFDDIVVTSSEEIVETNAANWDLY